MIFSLIHTADEKYGIYCIWTQLWIFYVLLTVHLGIIFVNNQLDVQFFFSYMFISILYMFRAAMWPSSGELIVSIHLVYVSVYR
jgi:hypothetical protein